MSMAVEYRPQPLAAGMGYDSNRYSQPHFTNPWHSAAAASAGAQHSGIYQTAYAQHSSPTSLEHPSAPKPQLPMSMGYAANPAASSLGSDLVPTRSYGSTCAPSIPTTQPGYAAPPAPRYSPERVPAAAPAGSYGYDADPSRRSSYATTSGSSRASFSDEMASARGMVAMANGHDMTPRNIYGTGNPRSASQESYGFPSAHSHGSSISSGAAYPYYGSSYNGSADGSSMTDYSSGTEDARTLPGTNQLINGFPPEPTAMMNQFNAKVSPSPQKKHKCKICEKRFTRPSSLQTHMYSHTGEKPFACDHEGCGRQFSVVSNLRRHKKVHREDNQDDGLGTSPGEED